MTSINFDYGRNLIEFLVLLHNIYVLRRFSKRTEPRVFLSSFYLKRIQVFRAAYRKHTFRIWNRYVSGFTIFAFLITSLRLAHLPLLSAFVVCGFVSRFISSDLCHWNIALNILLTLAEAVMAFGLFDAVIAFRFGDLIDVNDFSANLKAWFYVKLVTVRELLEISILR